jgi:DNA-directed RNA polymerase specialized sigma24 family protein
MEGRSATEKLPAFESVLEEDGPAVLAFCISRAGPDLGEDVFQRADGPG